MRKLYPAIEPRRSFYLDTGDGHSLYVEESGELDKGIPVVFLHGGPGAGCDVWHRRFFHPEKYRIILFDQRGAGRSTPHAELKNNTTQLLVQDMEKLREKLDIEQWVVFGGSWGSTLALAYAEAYPKRCLHLILRGIFLCRHQDIHWFYQNGANRLFPDLWHDFECLVPKPERENMVAAYYRLLTSPDEEVRLKAAVAWSTWEGKTLSLLPDPAIEASFVHAHRALSLARIECHYFLNQIFLPENALLDQSQRLAQIPGTIVHGRYDIVCPVDQAFSLQKRWPRAKLHVVANAGHAASERGIIHHLVHAADAVAERLT